MIRYLLILALFTATQAHAVPKHPNTCGLRLIKGGVEDLDTVPMGATKKTLTSGNPVTMPTRLQREARLDNIAKHLLNVAEGVTSLAVTEHDLRFALGELYIPSSTARNFNTSALLNAILAHPRSHDGLVAHAARMTIAHFDQRFIRYNFVDMLTQFTTHHKAGTATANNILYDIERIYLKLGGELLDAVETVTDHLVPSESGLLALAKIVGHLDPSEARRIEHILRQQRVLSPMIAKNLIDTGLKRLENDGPEIFLLVLERMPEASSDELKMKGDITDVLTILLYELTKKIIRPQANTEKLMQYFPEIFNTLLRSPPPNMPMVLNYLKDIIEVLANRRKVLPLLPAYRYARELSRTALDYDRPNEGIKLGFASENFKDFEERLAEKLLIENPSR